MGKDQRRPARRRTRPARSQAKHSQRVKQYSISSEIKDKIFDLQARIEPWGSASYIWQFVLAPSEQEFLGGNLDDAFASLGGTVGMLEKLWGCSPAAAILRLYERIGSLPDSELARLRREFNLLPMQPDNQAAKPVWNATTGQLLFRGTVVRRCRGRSVARNIFQILDKFEDAKWPSRIDDPLPGVSDPQRLRETVRTLNLGLQMIRFFADGDGKGVIWEET